MIINDECHNRNDASCVVVVNVNDNDSVNVTVICLEYKKYAY